MASERPICSYESKCYRRNPEHFRLVDHPHLDNLLIGNTGDRPIQLPTVLNFECNNRHLLSEQLEILRKVKRERYKIETPKNTETSTSRLDPNLPVIDLTVEEKKHNRPPQAKILQMLARSGHLPSYVPKPGQFLKKYELAAPYHIFFTAVQKSTETWKQKLSVTLSEILDRSLGEIVSSFHLSFVINIGWLCMQYLLAEQKSDTVVFAHYRDDEDPLPPSIEYHEVKSPYNFGSHHTKMSLLQYKDNGIRVMISTANLYNDDWDLRTQSLWVSPNLPQLPNTARDEDGESKTGFKADLIKYFSQYKQDTSKWMSILLRTDFSSVNVVFVASVPGLYRAGDEATQWGHRRLGKILANHAEIPKGEGSTTIVATASSIGSCGPSYGSWITTDIVGSMSRAKNQFGQSSPAFKLVYPTIENYKRSYDLMEGGNCLTYHETTHARQKWIKDHMYQWVASRSNRTQAMPHMKMYFRLSADERRVSWLLLGSANVSKAAWGYLDRGGYKILSYEAGVLFLPKFFNGGTEFPIKMEDSTAKAPIIPIPFNLPLTPYDKTDEPYLLLASQK